MYTWEVTLHDNTIYAIEIDDSIGNGWDINSYVIFKLNEVVIGNYTLLNDYYDQEELRIGNLPLNLRIEEESDCVKLIDNQWKSIYIASGLCNSMTNDLHIENYPVLENIIIKPESLMNLNSLTISSNPVLCSITTNNNQISNAIGAFHNVKTVEISCN